MYNSIKKTIYLLFIMIAMPHLSISATLQNNSFESGVGKIKLGGASGWTPFGTANSTVISNSAIAHSGTNHLSLFQNFSGGNNYSGLYQKFSATQGDKLLFSTFLRNGREADYLQEGNSAWLQVEFWNNGSHVSTIQNNINGQGIDSNTPQDDQWLLNSMSITVPENIDTIRFIAIHAYIGTNYNGGSSSFDDLTVKLVEKGTLFSFK